MRYPFPIKLLLAILLATSCGPKPIPRESSLDTPANQYARGLALLEAGDLFEAQRAFERARGLDDDFPGAYVGNALVAAEQGDFFGARKELERAIHKDNDYVDAHIALGRVVVREGVSRGEAADKWLDEALRALRKAENLDKDNPAVPFYQGLVYREAIDFPRARDAYARVIALNRGPLVEKAMAEMARLQAVERSSPGSKVGMKIALEPRISRAELAVLLLEELKLDELLAKRRLPGPAPSFRPPGQEEGGELRPTDVEGSWARPWIEQVLDLGVSGLELFPDQTFRPDEPLTRANYALVNQGVLMLLSGDRSLATRYIGEKSRFPDVRGDFYAYNAIALNAERGIMAADRRTGLFRPEDTVSGAEALLIIRELQNAFRMEY